MSRHQWEWRAGWESLPYCSWPGHYACVLCALSGAETLGEIQRLSEDCPGTRDSSAQTCQHCGLCQVWTGPYCPRCDYPPIPADVTPADYHRMSQEVERRRSSAQ